MKILKYNKYVFLKEAYSEFNQFSQLNVTPSSLGFAGYGFAIDNSLSIYGQKDSPYTNQYYRTPMMVNTLLGVIQQVQKDITNNYGNIKFDYFLEDVEKYSDFKILRININNNLCVDVYISFLLNGEEFFGVFKNFNSINRQLLKTDLFSDYRYRYIDYEYKLKLDNYFKKILEKWFRPSNGVYKCLADEVQCYDKMGNKFNIKKNTKIEVKSSSGNITDPYVKFFYKNEIYIINGNNYYFFNYWFNKIE